MRNDNFNSSAYSVGICTLGCRVNQYESRAIAEKLEEKGFEIRAFSEVCDAYIINTCAVTAESERKSRQMARRANKRNPDAVILVTGCQAQLHPEDAEAIDGVRYVGGNASKLEVADAVEKLLADRETVILNTQTITAEYEQYSVSKPDHTRAYIKIEDGCKNKCAYCVIPKVRGPVRSKPFADVVEEVKAVAAIGYREIVLTGIEVTDYQYGLPELINAVSAVEGIERVRLASVNPAFIKPEFIDIIKNNPKFCHHFHLSLQSCCDKTLRAMRRPYNTSILKKNIAYVKEALPDIAFTADIICGFPGETEEDFIETLKNTEELGLIHAHIFPYSPRPETEAADMPNQVPENIKNSRCERLSRICQESRNRIISAFRDEKKRFSVLFEESRGGYSYGHTENFIEVAVQSELPLDGKIHRVMLLAPIVCGDAWEAAIYE